MIYKRLEVRRTAVVVVVMMMEKRFEDEGGSYLCNVQALCRRASTVVRHTDTHCSTDTAAPTTPHTTPIIYWTRFTVYIRSIAAGGCEKKKKRREKKQKNKK